MTQVVTVHTDFTDLNQMAQGLVGRVNDTHVILPGPDPVDVGDWVQFAVTLYDGTPGFAGVGRCVTVVDNGEERLSHQRFDVVIDSLQFDSRGQQVFEHILTLNGGGEYPEDEGEPAAQAPTYAEVPEAPFEDVSDDFTSSKLELPSDALDDAEEEATMIGDSMAFAAAHHAKETAETRPPPAPLPVSLADDDDDDDFDMPAIAAPRVSTFSEPPTGSRMVPPEPAATKQSNGAASFLYPEGLPFPAKPPRPQLDPSQRVSPAPRPRPSH
jgi:hypothetical protein